MQNKAETAPDVIPTSQNDEDKARRKSREAGFTLIELLVVMAILVMIASLVAPRVIGYLGSSRTKTASIQIESLSTALELFKIDVGRYPTEQEGLDALVRRPPGVFVWNGPYLRTNAVPKDPWGSPYIYRSPGQQSAYQIMSLGADQQPGGRGEDADVTNR